MQTDFAYQKYSRLHGQGNSYVMPNLVEVFGLTLLFMVLVMSVVAMLRVAECRVLSLSDYVGTVLIHSVKPELTE